MRGTNRIQDVPELQTQVHHGGIWTGGEGWERRRGEEEKGGKMEGQSEGPARFGANGGGFIPGDSAMNDNTSPGAQPNKKVWWEVELELGQMKRLNERVFQRQEKSLRPVLIKQLLDAPMDSTVKVDGRF